MDAITEFKVIDCPQSEYVQPLRFYYKQNGIYKTWDVVQSHNRKVLIFVKQYRAAVHFTSMRSENQQTTIDLTKHPGSKGITIELCAGIVDKKLSIAEVARQEVLEECGYNVPASSLELVTKIRGNDAIMGDWQTMFYAEVTDEMRVGAGGGNITEGEFIEVMEMGIPDVRKYVARKDVMSPAGMLYGVLWFLSNKAKEFES